jgi:hypothetical protein
LAERIKSLRASHRVEATPTRAKPQKSEPVRVRRPAVVPTDERAPVANEEPVSNVIPMTEPEAPRFTTDVNRRRKGNGGGTQLSLF